MTEEIKQKIVDIINSHRGDNIGTGLKFDLEREINAILMSNWEYTMSFNMSGEVSHRLTNGKEIIEF